MSILDEIKNTADKAVKNPHVQEAVGKAKDFINSEKGKQTIEKAKDKVEDFVHDKTNGKGIFGFGKD